MGIVISIVSSGGGNLTFCDLGTECVGVEGEKERRVLFWGLGLRNCAEACQWVAKLVSIGAPMARSPTR